jgi:RTX calcium-binding nonapeptide repeat (4 copies)
MSGDSGNDFVYTSHGRNTVRGGAGRDRIFAHWGRGVIDCGPGRTGSGSTRSTCTTAGANCERRVQW